MIDITEIRKEYAYNGDVFCNDAPQIRMLKAIVDSLPPSDRNLILMYAETASYRKMGVMLGLSHMTVYNEVARIKKTIIERYNDNTHNNGSDRSDNNLHR